MPPTAAAKVNGRGKNREFDTDVPDYSEEDEENSDHGGEETTDNEGEHQDIRSIAYRKNRRPPPRSKSGPHSEDDDEDPELMKQRYVYKNGSVKPFSAAAANKEKGTKRTSQSGRQISSKQQRTSSSSGNSSSERQGSFYDPELPHEDFCKVTSFSQVESRMKAMEWRLFDVIQKLENKLEGFSKVVSSVSSNKNKNKFAVIEFKLSSTQKCQIATMVRHKMWRSVKFMDNTMMASQGHKIYQNCLEAAGIKVDEEQDQQNRNAVFKEVIQCARYYINNHKCHMKKTLRMKAAGK